MTDDALSVVARGIGMRWLPYGAGMAWYEPDDVSDESRSVIQAHLRTYLLTGDRPMRIMEKRGICLTPIYSVRKQQIVRWAANHLMGPDTIHEAPTPAEAILACAMNIAVHV
jgi:hypothetical protein